MISFVEEQFFHPDPWIILWEIGENVKKNIWLKQC